MDGLGICLEMKFYYHTLLKREWRAKHITEEKAAYAVYAIISSSLLLKLVFQCYLRVLDGTAASCRQQSAVQLSIHGLSGDIKILSLR